MLTTNNNNNNSHPTRGKTPRIPPRPQLGRVQACCQAKCRISEPFWQIVCNCVDAFSNYINNNMVSCFPFNERALFVSSFALMMFHLFQGGGSRSLLPWEKINFQNLKNAILAHSGRDIALSQTLERSPYKPCHFFGGPPPTTL